jgi:starch-binding outer membrane protein, SusD/RagB family
MKKIKFIVFACLGIILINSCAESDFDLKDPNADPAPSFAELVKTESDVAGLVAKCYTGTRTISLYGRLIPYMMDNMAQENGSNPQQEADKITFTNFSFGAGNPDIANYWSACYIGIRKCNLIISNESVLRAVSGISTERENRYLGEARFMRGLYYFMLVTRFGGVPLYNSQVLSTDGIKGRSSQAEVYSLIVSDFAYAASVLGEKGVEAKGRATKSAANAFLGKALLYQKSYPEALDAFNKVTGYSLTTDYYDNFVEEKEYGSESIFEIDYDINRGSGLKWSAREEDRPDGEGAGNANVTFRGQDYGHLDWFNVWPSDNLAAAYEPGDKRVAGTIYNVGDAYLNGTKTVKLSDFGGLAPRAWKKYQNYYKQDSENLESGINMKMFRYADLLLMKAECENFKSGGSQSIAIGYINEVRVRAGLSVLSTTLNKDEVFKAIIKERRVELAGEQSRFDDVVRWRNAETELAGSAFQVKNYLWPIPSKEFSTNFKLTPADQNPGY